MRGHGLPRVHTYITHAHTRTHTRARNNRLDGTGNIVNTFQRLNTAHTLHKWSFAVLLVSAVELTGYHNDAVFDQRDVEFVLGEGESIGIIEGLEIALKKFKKGEKSRLKIRSEYAYGSKGCPEKNVPADADLVYDVTLKEFEKVSVVDMVRHSEGAIVSRGREWRCAVLPGREQMCCRTVNLSVLVEKISTCYESNPTCCRSCVTRHRVVHVTFWLSSISQRAEMDSLIFSSRPRNPGNWRDLRNLNSQNYSKLKEPISSRYERVSCLQPVFPVRMTCFLCR